MKEQGNTAGKTDIDKQVGYLELPILQHAKEIKEAISKNDVVIVVGETGSGKTTQIPLMALETLGEGEKIAITQPRVLAAKSVSRFVAERLGSDIGKEVGYHVRFDNKTTKETKANFMTDGILLNKMQNDPTLSEFSAVMVDEVHERSVNIDLILGNLKRIQQLRKESNLEPLKILVTSATLEREKLSKYFDGAPVIEVSGRTYPVDVEYVLPTSWLDEDEICPNPTPLVREIVEEDDGDILIFAPGVDEINRIVTRLNREKFDNVIILPLHGTLPPVDQDKIFEKTSKRKIIVATNIAETSITVPGIKVVVDTGLVKEIEFNHNTGISALVVKSQTQDGCEQRKGRAGRIEAGKCYRLYHKNDFESRNKFHIPEIQRLDLAEVVLTMKKMGIDDVKTFEFLDPPKKESLNQAIQTLTRLGALDEKEDITELGKQMAELPLEPHLARMVIEAKKYECESEVTTIVAFLGLKPVFLRFDEEKDREKYYLSQIAHARFQNGTSDFLTLLNVWREYQDSGFSDDWVKENFLNPKVLKEVEDVRNQLFEILGIDKENKNEVSNDLISKSIVMGLIDNLALSREGTYAYSKINGDGEFFIHPGSTLFKSRYDLITAAKILASSKVYGSFVQRVKPEWITGVMPDLVRISYSDCYYDGYEDRIVRDRRYSWKKFGRTFSIEVEQVEGIEAGKAFADHFVNSYVDSEVIMENRKIGYKLHGLYIRTNGNKLFEISDEDIKAVYRKKMGTVASVKEYWEKVRKGELDMSFSLDDFVSPELIKKTMEEYPDVAKINGKEYKVRYSEEFDLRHGNKENVVELVVPIKELSDGSFKLPSMLFGRSVKLFMTDDSGFERRIYFTDPEFIKGELNQFWIDSQWKKWSENPSNKALVPVAIRLDKDIVLPEGEEYGTDLETGEKLISVPVLTRQYSYSSGDRYFIKHCKDKNEAEKEKVTVPTTPVYREPEYRIRTPNYSTSNESPLRSIKKQPSPEILDEINLLRQRENSKPRRRALLFGELIDRGLDEVETAKISIKECEAALPQLNAAKMEADKNYDRGEVRVLEAMIKTVESTALVLEASKSDSVKTYIGDDLESVRDFQNRLMVLINKRKEKPDKNELENLISDVIEEMTS